MAEVISAVVLISIIFVLGFTFGYVVSMFTGRKKDGPGPGGGD